MLTGFDVQSAQFPFVHLPVQRFSDKHALAYAGASRRALVSHKVYAIKVEALLVQHLAQIVDAMHSLDICFDFIATVLVVEVFSEDFLRCWTLHMLVDMYADRHSVFDTEVVGKFHFVQAFSEFDVDIVADAVVLFYGELESNAYNMPHVILETDVLCKLPRTVDARKHLAEFCQFQTVIHCRLKPAHVEVTFGIPYAVTEAGFECAVV